MLTDLNKVHSMTRFILQSIQSGNRRVLADLHQITGEELDSSWVPKTTQEIANRIFCVSITYGSLSRSSTSIQLMCFSR